MLRKYGVAMIFKIMLFHIFLNIFYGDISFLSKSLLCFKKFSFSCTFVAEEQS